MGPFDMKRTVVNWDSPTWGALGSNVHVTDSGSYLDAEAVSDQ